VCVDFEGYQRTAVQLGFSFRISNDKNIYFLGHLSAIAESHTLAPAAGVPCFGRPTRLSVLDVCGFVTQDRSSSLFGIFSNSDLISMCKLRLEVFKRYMYINRTFN
jgi:hypothetical protein